MTYGFYLAHFSPWCHFKLHVNETMTETQSFQLARVPMTDTQSFLFATAQVVWSGTIVQKMCQVKTICHINVWSVGSLFGSIIKYFIEDFSRNLNIWFRYRIHCTLVMKTVLQNELNTPKKRKYVIKWTQLKISKIAYILFRFRPELTFSITDVF